MARSTASPSLAAAGVAAASKDKLAQPLAPDHAMGAKRRAVHDTSGGPTMLAGPLAGTILYAVARGLPWPRITEATGLVPEHLIELDARVPEHLMPVVWRLIGEAFPDEAFALQMAASVPSSFFGPLVHATRYAPDLRAGLELLVRYASVLSSRLHTALLEGPQQARLEFVHALDDEDEGRASDLGVGLNARFLRELLGVDDVLLRVELAHRPFGPPRAYAEFFAVPVRFEAPRNALVVRAAALDRPLPERNPPMLRYIVDHLELVRERHLARRGDAELVQIREAIVRNAERGEYGVEALAERLCTSLRSLQRRVRALGTTLRALVDEVRETNARQFLSDPRLSIGEIAFLLGYSTESAFRRAFKRWTGEPPTSMRPRTS